MAELRFVYWEPSGVLVERIRRDSQQLWIIAVLFFGLGDAVTTIVGLRLAAVAEVNPAVAVLTVQSTLGGILVMKSTFIGACYILWKHTPQAHRVGIPLSLATVGVLVTVWNILVLLSVILT